MSGVSRASCHTEPLVEGRDQHDRPVTDGELDAPLDVKHRLGRERVIFTSCAKQSREGLLVAAGVELFN